MVYQPVKPDFPGGGQGHANDSFLEKDQLSAGLFNEYERTMQQLVDNEESSSYPEKMWGRSTLNSTTGREIVHNKGLSLYTVEVTVLGNSSTVGVVTVDTSDPDKFVVYNSGVDTASAFVWNVKALPYNNGIQVSQSATFSSVAGVFSFDHGYPFDDQHISDFVPIAQPSGTIGSKWVDRAAMIDSMTVSGTYGGQACDLMLDGFADSELTGTLTLASTAGVTIPHSLGTADIDVLVVPVEDPAGTPIGDIRVEATSTNFTVYNSGAALVDAVYVILDTDTGSFFQRGNASFVSGASNGVTITHNKGDRNYYIYIIPSADTSGNLGRVWIEKNENDVKVLNDGTANTAFKYRIIDTTDILL